MNELWQSPNIRWPTQRSWSTHNHQNQHQRHKTVSNITHPTLTPHSLAPPIKASSTLTPAQCLGSLSRSFLQAAARARRTWTIHTYTSVEVFEPLYSVEQHTNVSVYSCFLAIFVGRFVFQSCTSSVPPATFNQLDAFAAVRRPSDTVGAEWAPPYTSRVHHSFNVACALLHPFPLNANRKHQLDTCTQ